VIVTAAGLVQSGNVIFFFMCPAPFLFPFF